MSEHPGQSDITFCIDVGNDGSSHVSVIKESISNVQTSISSDRQRGIYC